MTKCNFHVANFKYKLILKSFWKPVLFWSSTFNFYIIVEINYVPLKIKKSLVYCFILLMFQFFWVNNKARLVGKGCSQKQGIDYDEISNVFFLGELSDEIYMDQPECYNDGSGKVCKLLKSIYGLKQASRVWNIKLTNVLMTAGYKRSQLDPCIFFKLLDQRKIFIAIYVDDVLTAMFWKMSYVQF